MCAVDLNHPLLTRAFLFTLTQLRIRYRDSISQIRGCTNQKLPESTVRSIISGCDSESCMEVVNVNAKKKQQTDDET